MNKIYLSESGMNKSCDGLWVQQVMERKIKLYVDRTSKHIIFVYLDYVLYSNLTRFVSIKHKAPVLYDTGNLRI